MLRSFAFAAGDALLPDRTQIDLLGDDLPVGRTIDIPFSQLEVNASTRVKAAQADNAEVDLSQWAESDESLLVADARAVLRKFVNIWWARFQERKALDWLNSASSVEKKEDSDAIADCIRRAKGCTYWSWTRGSRMFFWKFPEEWRNDFRDGVPFWKVTNPPTGYMLNMKAPSHEAELATRLKIFKLKFSYYLDRDMVNLLIPRFIVPKVVADDGTILDVRCVWDCKINGHNKTLYAPSFMLPTALDRRIRL